MNAIDGDKKKRFSTLTLGQAEEDAQQCWDRWQRWLQKT
jgi:hypothetical protein